MATTTKYECECCKKCRLRWCNGEKILDTSATVTISFTGVKTTLLDSPLDRCTHQDCTAYTWTKTFELSLQDPNYYHCCAYCYDSSCNFVTLTGPFATKAIVIFFNPLDNSFIECDLFDVSCPTITLSNVDFIPCDHVTTLANYYTYTPSFSFNFYLCYGTDQANTKAAELRAAGHPYVAYTYGDCGTSFTFDSTNAGCTWTCGGGGFSLTGPLIYSGGSLADNTCGTVTVVSH